jgi:hypothetical protein
MKVLRILVGLVLLVLVAGCVVSEPYGGGYAEYYGPAPVVAPSVGFYFHRSPWDRDHYWDRHHYWERHRYWHRY